MLIYNIQIPMDPQGLAIESGSNRVQFQLIFTFISLLVI